jgi:hypothetical protein
LFKTVTGVIGSLHQRVLDEIDVLPVIKVEYGEVEWRGSHVWRRYAERDIDGEHEFAGRK